ncbi:MAG: alpha-galactosidase [Candidatus Helarchaeota archaeon]
MVILENNWLKVIYYEETGFFDIVERKEDKVLFERVFSMVELIDANRNKLKISSISVKIRDVRLEEGSDEYGIKKSIIIVHHYENDIDFTLIITLYVEKPLLLFQNSVKVNESTYRFHCSYPFLIEKIHGGNMHLGELRHWRVFYQDWQSWSSAQVISLKRAIKRTWMRVPSLIMYSTKEKLKKGEYLSDNIAAIKNIETQQFVTLGAISMKDYLTHIGLQVNLHRDEVHKFFARVSGDGIPLPLQEEVFSEKFVLICTGMNPVQSLTRYATMVQHEMKALSWTTTPTGWCSWYYFFTRVSQEAVLQNAEFVANHKDLPLEIIQIDDGYLPARFFNSCIGDWLTVNKRFSKGLKWLADEIRKKGFKPGLWTAPFIVSKSSKLYKEHPDWVIRNSKGKPIVVNIPTEWGIFNKIYGLDTTHPEVQQWLRTLFTTLVQDYGFQFLKLDFIYAAAIRGSRYDQSLTRVQAYRKGLEVIRDAVGENVFLLGCGAPLGPSVGLVHGMRVSNDTFFAFNQPILYKFLNILFFAGLGDQPSIISALKTSMIRFFMHKHFWLNDPDCLLVRQTRSLLKPHEIEFEITFIGLSGGILLSSDNLPELTSNEINYLKLLLPPLSTAAIPLDLFEHSPPQIYKLTVPATPLFDQYYLIGIFNWTKKAQVISISRDVLQLTPNQDYHIFDFWEKYYFSLKGTEVKQCRLQKNQAKFLIIRPQTPIPQLLATTFHFSSGAREISQYEFNPDSNELFIEITKPGKTQGTLYISVPASYEVKKLHSDALNSVLSIHSHGVISVQMEMEDRASLTLNFQFSGSP